MVVWILLGIALVIVILNRVRQKEKEDFEQRNN